MVLRANRVWGKVPFPYFGAAMRPEHNHTHGQPLPPKSEFLSLRDNAGWTYEGAALESSSFMRMSRIMSWFTANIGYHHIHHLNSRIPFYRLPEVLQGIPELQTPKTTSLNPVEIVRCLRLKVWDVDAQRMVGLRSVSRASRPLHGGLPGAVGLP